MKSIVALLIICTLFVSTSYAENEKYRVVIYFGSICCGPDVKDISGVNKFISSFETKKQVKLSAASPSGSIGEEGEHAKCYKLKELSNEAQKELIEGVKNLLINLKAAKDHSRDGETTVHEYSLCP